MLRWLVLFMTATCILFNLLNSGSHHGSQPRWFWHLWWRTHLIWQWGLLPLLVLLIGTWQQQIISQSGSRSEVDGS